MSADVEAEPAGGQQHQGAVLADQQQGAGRSAQNSTTPSTSVTQVWLPAGW
jgi:hypothetical protein